MRPVSVTAHNINGPLILEEPSGGIRFGTDALLLADFLRTGKRCVDLGTGSGVLALLALLAGKAEQVTGIELQQRYADCASRNAAANGCADWFRCLRGDVCNIRDLLPAESADCVLTNPPYLPADCGKRNDREEKYLAFHESTATLRDFCAAASYLLHWGGVFSVVYRAEYLPKLFDAMREYRLEPKRLRVVYPSQSKPPLLVLAEGRKGGAESMIFEPPFYLYQDAAHTIPSPGMQQIYELFRFC